MYIHRQAIFRIILSILTVCFLFEQSVSAAGDMKVLPTFRGNHHNTGVFPGPAPVKGKLKWKFKAESRIRSSPIVHNGVVYFGSSLRTRKGKLPYLYAVDSETGKMLWKFKTETSINNSPVIDGKTIYVGDNYKTLYAIDLDTHKLKWVFKAKEDFDLASPIVIDQKLYIGNMDDNFYALDLKQNGLDIWTFKANRGIMEAAAYQDGILFFTSNRKLWAVKAKNGEKLWYYKAKKYFYGTPAIADDIVYIGNKKKMLHAIDMASGKLKWSFKAQGVIRTTPAITEDTIFFGSDKDAFYALSRQDQSIRWKFDIPSDKVISVNSPVIAGNYVYFGLVDGNIYGLDTQTGAVKWNFKIGAVRSRSGFIFDGVYFIGSDDTYLYAIE